MKTFDFKQVQLVNELVQNIDPVDGEIWRPIKDYDGFYLISNLGRVYSLARRISKNGKTICTKPSKMLKQSNGTKGYKLVNLCHAGKEKRNKTFKVHRLVAEHFLPNQNNYEAVNHLNLNKKDNTVFNLEWCSNKQNIEHAIKNGAFKNRDHGFRKKSRAVTVIDNNGVLIGRFPTIKKTANALKISTSRIYTSINENRIVGKYKFNVL
jgi:hypothetical protein